MPENTFRGNIYFRMNDGEEWVLCEYHAEQFSDENHEDVKAQGYAPQGYPCDSCGK